MTVCTDRMITLDVSHTEPSRNGWQVANEAPDRTCCTARSILATSTGTIVWVPICLPSPSQQVCTVVALGLAAAPPSPARDLRSQQGAAACSLSLRALTRFLACWPSAFSRASSSSRRGRSAAAKQGQILSGTGTSQPGLHLALVLLLFLCRLASKSQASQLVNEFMCCRIPLRRLSQSMIRSVSRNLKTFSPESTICLDACADLDLQPSLPIAEGLLHVRLLLCQCLPCERPTSSDVG